MKIILIRLLLIVGGYVFGLFQTGYFLGKITGRDLRKEGSGNTGATNTLRVMGLKYALIVFFFDALKAFIPCLIVRFIFKTDPYKFVYLMYTALGVILGNDYPFYLHFKGGKGVAASSGYALAWNWMIWLFGMGLFFLIAVTTGYVSLASITTVITIVVAGVFYCIKMGFSAPVFIEFMVILTALQAILIWRHRTNIQRLLAGKENRFGHKKK